MQPFQLSRIPKTWFGANAIQRIADILKDAAHEKILLITGKRSFIETPAYRLLVKSLNQRNWKFVEGRVGEEPSPELIDELTRMARENKVDFVIAIGGGSVLDAGKAVSAMIKVDGSAMEYLEGVGAREHPGLKVPMIAVPTTAGTGSETTKNAVISRIGTNGFKKSLRHDNFVPDFAIIDPILHLNCPPDVTAASAMDAMNQLLEGYLSKKANALTDALALSGIEKMISSIEQAYQNGNNVQMRSKVAYGAYLSGIVLANAGLGVVHGFASSIGGLAPLPHGIICGKLNAVVMEAIVAEIINKPESYPLEFKKLIRLCDVISIERTLSPQDRMREFIKLLYSLEQALRIPAFSELGFTREQAEFAASMTSCKESPVTFDKKMLFELLSKCM